MNPRMPVQIPRELANRVIEFATNETNIQTRFMRNGYDENRRRFCNLNSFPELPLTQDVKQFAKIAYEQIGVTDFIEEHKFGNFIGVNSHGGNVHQHTDPRNDIGYFHIRLNFLLQKPIIGGNPIIDGIEYPLNEGDSWINYASEWQHASTPVDGGRDRVVLSLGAYVPPDVVQKITDKITLNATTPEIDFSRVLRPQENAYDLYVMKHLKQRAGWKSYTYPHQLLQFDKKICILPRDSYNDFVRLQNIDFETIQLTWKQHWMLGYTNIISLVDIITPHFREQNKQNTNLSGHVLNVAEYGYPNTWGIMSTFVDTDIENSACTFTNIFHELMHWKLLALGFGTGPNTFFPTTKEFILNDESELCWSIVNSYDDTAQAAVGHMATDRPVSASLHAYVSFLGVAYSYVQFLKVNPRIYIAREKTKLWGSRFEKSFEELLKVGRFTPKGEQLMKGLGQWTADFYKEYKEVL